MTTKTVPFSEAQIREIIDAHPTPFHLYDEAAIRALARQFRGHFVDSGLAGYRNYFAVKALPNPSIMEILMHEGMGFDCSSLAELLLCERIGAHCEALPNGLPRIMFTSNETPYQEYQKAVELGAIINLDDITHIPYFAQYVGAFPSLMSFRYNPGPQRSFSKRNDFIIGNPEEAKFGMTREQLFEGYRMLKERGVREFGLHTMVASNEIVAEAFVETARMLLELVVDLSRQLDIHFRFINLGGGFGVSYRPEENPLDIAAIAGRVRDLHAEMIAGNGLPDLDIVTENGRIITGPHGYLVTTVRHTKDIYRKYLGVDATMANLMRPGMYGAYHHISVLGKDPGGETEVYDVVGSLCENNDKFAVQRELPVAGPGDTLVIHDSGAHGHAMGFNYNGKLRSAELLLEPDGSTRLIRRAETLDDLFRTLEFDGLFHGHK